MINNAMMMMIEKRFSLITTCITVLAVMVQPGSMSLSILKSCNFLLDQVPYRMPAVHVVLIPSASQV